jgi:hypothetical protein
LVSKKSIAVKLSWQNPAVRKRHVEGMKNAWKNPEYRKKMEEHLRGIAKLGGEMSGIGKSEEIRNNSRKRMLENNPMKNPIIAKRVAEKKTKIIELKRGYWFGYFLGALTGDGTQDGYQFWFRVVDYDFINAIKHSISEAFGLETKIRYVEKYKQYAIALTSKLVSHIVMQSNFDSLDDEEKRGYIAGFFDAEGSVARYAILMYQKDRSILDKISSYLHGKGLDAAIYRRINNSGNPIHTLYIRGGKEKRRFFFEFFQPHIRRKKAFIEAGIDDKTKYSDQIESKYQRNIHKC